ncbi:hypothetical protein ACVWXO_008068 [Bradyrhizobium sp. LM2.7]
MWITIEVERVLRVDRGRNVILCDPMLGPGHQTLVLKLRGDEMTDKPTFRDEIPTGLPSNWRELLAAAPEQRALIDETAAEVALEQSEWKGNWVRTVRLASGEEIVCKVPQRSAGNSEAKSLIAERLADLRAANDTFRGMDWDKSSEIQRNDREIRWLLDLRSVLTVNEPQAVPASADEVGNLIIDEFAHIHTDDARRIARVVTDRYSVSRPVRAPGEGRA